MIEPGSTIGILGGGQLGKMTALAAANLGYRTHIYCPSSDSPAFQVSDTCTQNSYTDPDSLRAFGKSVDVITFEFENVPHSTVEILEEYAPVRPGWNALYTSQNRLREKNMANKLGIATTAFNEIHCLTDLQAAVLRMKSDCLLKTVEFGYDGKGQCWIDTNSNLEAIWETFDTECAILEEFIPFEMELSMIVARDLNGACVPFPMAKNIHKNGILDISEGPADIEPSIEKEAFGICKTLAESLNLVGLLAVEFFLTDDSRLLLNEIAPRPHNSGHWTMDGCQVSQFEQFIRAICGLPLIEPKVHSPIKMQNLIGDQVHLWKREIEKPEAKIHLYGKKEVKPGRKMGHINYVIPSRRPGNTMSHLHDKSGSVQ